MSILSVRLPDDLKEEAAALAKEMGGSLNQFIVASLTSRVAAQKAANRYFETRRSQAEGFEDFEKIMGCANPVEPQSGDEITAD